MKRLIIWLCFILSLCLSCGLANANSSDTVLTLQAWQSYTSQQNQTLQRYTVAGPVAAGQSVTITSQVRITDLGGVDLADAPDVTERVWLAGVAAGARETPTLLALTLEPDVANWFPTWRLCLRSEAGLLLNGTDRLELGPVLSPATKGDYISYFSYDPGQGALSLRIMDMAKAKVIYAGNFELRKYSGTVYPSIGTQGSSAVTYPAMGIQSVTAQSVFIPVGAAARLVTPGSNGGAYVDLRSGNRKNEWALDLSLPDRALDNQVRLIVNSAGTRSVLYSTEQGGDRLVPLKAASVPAGQVDISLEYEVDGATWEFFHTQLQVGALSAKIADLQLVTGIDGKPELAGAIDVTGDAAMPPFNLNLSYNVSVPGISAPLYQRWDKTAGIFTVPVLGLGSATKHLPFRIPLDRLVGTVVGKEVFTEVAVAADLGLPFTFSGETKFVLGERAPVFPKVEDYYVLRGDFHIHTTLSDGDISPVERVWESYKYGYDTFALTDHRTSDAYGYSQAYAADLGLTLIKGFETGLDKREHLIVLGSDDTYKMRDEHSWSPQPNSSHVFYQDQAREVVDHGGYIIYAHPGGQWMPPGPYKNSNEENGWTSEMAWLIQNGYIRGVESRWNLPEARRDAPYRWALQYGLTLLDVSDAHESRDFNKAAQAPVTLVLARDKSDAEVMDALRNGRTLIWRDGVLRGTETWLVPFVNAMLDLKMIDRDGQTYLQMINKGAITLSGRIQFAGDRFTLPVSLIPGGKTYLPCRKDATTASISWANVYSGPEELLKTDHKIANGDI